MASWTDAVTDSAVKAVKGLFNLSLDTRKGIADRQNQYADKAKEKIFKLMDLPTDLLEKHDLKYTPIYLTLQVQKNINKLRIHLGIEQSKELYDILRAGESVQNPTAMNILKDIGRVSIVFEGVGGVIKAVRVPVDKIVRGGGPMTCIFNTFVNSTNLSKQATITLADAAAADGKTLAKILSPQYGGGRLSDLEKMYAKVGVRIETIQVAGKGIAQQLEFVVAQSRALKDPLAFGIVMRGLDVSSHSMTAANRGGLVVFIDQFGEFVLKTEGGEMFMVCIRAHSGSKLWVGSRYRVSDMEFVTKQMYRVHEAFELPFGIGAGMHDVLSTLHIPLLETNLDALIGLATKIAEAKAGQRTVGSIERRRTVPKLHKTAKGDTLFGIAKLYYGDAARYREITVINPAVAGVVPHHQVPEGLTLIVP